MRIPDAVRKCVVYLGLEQFEGANKKVVYRGTGFFVGVPANSPDTGFLYLVTARHVAEKIVGKSFYIRANSTSGKSIAVEFKEDQLKWYYHPTDKAADVAIVPLAPSATIIDFEVIPIAMFLTEDIRHSKGIGAGDEVFITGLFAHHVGNAKNLPIIRTGNIAMIPDERIPIKNFGDMETYLIESRSIGGLSGSPVFVVEVINPLDRRIHLMGLIHGHWDVEPETIVDETVQDVGVKAGINVGIAIVTPASKILDIINCQELVHERNRQEIEGVV